MNKFANGYAEAYVILDSLIEEDYKKIPPEVIKAIEENRNLEYDFELDDDLSLKEQTLLPETKAILFNIFRDYLATPEQKEKIIKMQNEERQKNEIRKQEMYNSDIFENKKKNIEEISEEGSVGLVEYKESFIKKVWNYIKTFFRKEK